MANLVAHLHQAGGDLFPASMLEMDEGVIRHQLPLVQRQYMRHDAQCAADMLLAEFDIDTASGAAALARLRSCAGAGPSAFLEALPSGRWLVLPTTDLRLALRFRLGLDTMPAGAVGTQCLCGRHLQADDADHAMTCDATGGAGTMRHDHVNNVWCHLARLTGMSTSREPVLRELQRGAELAGAAVRRAGAAAAPPAAVQPDAAQPAADPVAAVEVIVDEGAQRARAGGPATLDTGRRGNRGDAIMSLPGGTIVTDVSVNHPAAQAYVRAAAEATGAAAARRDKEKMDKHRASAEGGACGFVPLSVETYGRMGAPAMQLLRDLAELASEGGAVDKQRWVQRALRKLSVGFMRGNA